MQPATPAQPGSDLQGLSFVMRRQKGRFAVWLLQNPPFLVAFLAFLSFLDSFQGFNIYPCYYNEIQTHSPRPFIVC